LALKLPRGGNKTRKFSWAVFSSDIKTIEKVVAKDHQKNSSKKLEYSVMKMENATFSYFCSHFFWVTATFFSTVSKSA
jgi:hypothetical protein